MSAQKESRVARATTPAAPGKERGSRPTGRGTGAGGKDARPPAPRSASGGEGSYVAGVISELRKVTWPSLPDLTRMTQVVIATVILFAALIGGLDFALGFVAKPLYTQQGTAAPTSGPSLAPPTLRPAATPAPSASGAATGAGASGTVTATTSATTSTAPAVTGSGTAPTATP